MKLHTKFSLSVGVLFLSLGISVSILEYSHLKSVVKRQAYQRCRRIIAEIEATQRYVREVLRPTVSKLIDRNNFIPEAMSTTFISRSIIERFQRQYPDYYFKFAALTPRNSINLADEHERQVIEQFKANPKLEEWQGLLERNGQLYYGVATPIRFKASCMRCHGNPADAPMALRKRYGDRGGFRRQVGDVAIKFVGIPLSKALASAKVRAFVFTGLAAMFLAGLFLTTNYFFRRFIIRPLQILQNGAKQIGNGKLDYRLGINTKDEFQELANNFNQMAEKLKASYSLLEQKVAERTAELQQEKAALQESEEKYRSLVENGLEGVYIYRGDRFLFVNPQISQMTGYSQDELMKMCIWDLVAPEDRERLKGYGRERAKGKPAPTRYEAKVLRKDGQTIVCEFAISTIMFQGELAIQGSVRDITERKRIEEEIRQERDKLKGILAAIGDGLCIITENHKIIHANEVLKEIVGKTKLEGQFCYRSFFERKTPCTDCPLQKAIENKRIERTEFTYPNGRTVESTFSPLKLTNGEMATIQIIKDVTEQRRLIREIEERRLYLEKLIAAAPDAIVTLDDQQHIIEWNPGAERLFGYKRDEALGQHLDHLIGKDDSFDEANNLTKVAMAGKSIPPTETVRYRKDGSPIDVIVTGAPIIINDKVVGVIAIYTDFSERKKLEAQLRQVQKMEAVGTLASGIAHDFNNLLGGILGYTSLLKMNLSKDDENYEYVDLIEKAGERAAELTSQLLAFSRRGKYEIQPLNLNHCVNNVIKLLNRTIDKNIEITTDLDKELPVVKGDPGQLEQAIMNICINAVQAMSVPNQDSETLPSSAGGTLHIETKVVHLDEEYVRSHLGAKSGDYVLLSITDTGCGMDEETKAKIFEPFFTTKEPGKGTGLGMAMVYGIVKNHGGYISVYSEIGEGSTIKIYLPIANETTDTEQKPQERKPLTGKETILVIDDEEVIRKVLKNMLEKLGYTVILAANGKEGTEIYRSYYSSSGNGNGRTEGNKNGSIDLVIVDMIMPKMGGRKTYHELKKINPNVKVLLASGYTQNGTAQQILDEGVQGFVHKPFSITELSEKVRKVLEE